MVACVKNCMHPFRHRTHPDESSSEPLNVSRSKLVISKWAQSSVRRTALRGSTTSTPEERERRLSAVRQRLREDVHILAEGISSVVLEYRAQAHAGDGAHRFQQPVTSL
mmetsp:Transcript_38604/g.102631  ORF Transcript_38604/g.102631 Transcript_38604/m.102631 type:complete len:109 (+) Transcript_38604:86-412(+)